LAPGEFLAPLDDDRVDEAEWRDVRVADVDDDDPAALPDLGRGESDAVGVVHRLEHIVHQTPNLVVHGFDRFGHLAEDGVAEEPDLSHCHGPYFLRTRRILPRATTTRVSPLLIVTLSSVRCTTSPMSPPSVMTSSPRLRAASISWCCFCSFRCGRMSRK